MFGPSILLLPVTPSQDSAGAGYAPGGRDRTLAHSRRRKVVSAFVISSPRLNFRLSALHRAPIESGRALTVESCTLAGRRVVGAGAFVAGLPGFVTITLESDLIAAMESAVFVDGTESTLTAGTGAGAAA